ncbi:MAG: serine hydrolase domain-containing protein [Bacteroidota bacterium]
MTRYKIIPLLTFLVIACGSQPSPGIIKPLLEPTRTEGFSPLSPKEKAYYANAIEPLYQSLLLRTGFNGSILVAKNGEIVFEDYHGSANFQTKEPIDSNTTFHVASVSKTFTATVILKLMEEGKLSIGDKVEKYLPSFPYPNITIEHLLDHRSGLPKYDHFMEGSRTEAYKVKNKKGRMVTRYRSIKVPLTFSGYATNDDVLQYLATKRPNLDVATDRMRKFYYSNTNYALLALIVEKITGMSFPTYMTTYVFKPLGMSHTYIFSQKDTANYQPSYYANKRAFKLEKLDCIYGDKNVYTTTRDLLLWDRALYLGTFVSTKTLEMAFQPYSIGESNYGLGWHLFVKPPEPTIVYHNGWWHGNNATFKRLVADTATVIILGNKFNSNIYRAGKMSSVFTGHVDTTDLEHEEVPGVGGHQ